MRFRLTGGPLDGGTVDLSRWGKEIAMKLSPRFRTVGKHEGDVRDAAVYGWDDAEKVYRFARLTEWEAYKTDEADAVI